MATMSENNINNEDQRIQLLKQASDHAQPISLSAALEVAGGIEFIVQLAEKGEIDPKDVDIIYVTDKFLQAIAAAPKENLRQSGKVIFHASVLLRMKAEALLAYKAPISDDYLDFNEDDGELIYDADKKHNCSSNYFSRLRKGSYSPRGQQS